MKNDNIERAVFMPCVSLWILPQSTEKCPGERELTNICSTSDRACESCLLIGRPSIPVAGAVRARDAAAG